MESARAVCAAVARAPAWPCAGPVPGGAARRRELRLLGWAEMLAILSLSGDAFVAPLPALRPQFLPRSHALMSTPVLPDGAFARRRRALLAASWFAALRQAAPPAHAEEVEADEVYLDAGTSGITPVQILALAVTFFSILPTPGMLGIGDDDVQRVERRRGFGFSSVDEAIDAARKADNTAGKKTGAMARPRCS